MTSPFVGNLLALHRLRIAHQQIPDVHARVAVENEEERRTTATPADALDRTAVSGRVWPRDQRVIVRCVMQSQCAVIGSRLRAEAARNDVTHPLRSQTMRLMMYRRKQEAAVSYQENRFRER